METGATPLTTSSDVGLASWMMLARVVDPVQIILLGRLDWSVHLDARVIGGTLRYTTPGHVTRTDGTYVLYNTKLTGIRLQLGVRGRLRHDSEVGGGTALQAAFGDAVEDGPGLIG